MGNRIARVALVGAVLLVASAEARASVTYFGGRVIPTVRMIPIYYGNSWSAADRGSTQTYLGDVRTFIAGGHNPAGKQTVYAQYGVTGGSLDPSRSVADGSPRVLHTATDIPNIIHAFQTQNNLAYSADKVFLLFPGPGYSTDFGDPCGYRNFEADAKYYAVVPHDCTTFQQIVSVMVLGTATDPNVDGWSGAVSSCLGHTVNFGFGNIALPFDNRIGACANVAFDNKADEILQLVVSVTGGGLFHTIRHANGAWDRFGDVKAAIGSDPGEFFDVDTQATLGVFNHVVGVVRGNRLFHTIRTDLGWTPFEDVNSLTGAQFRNFAQVGLANVNGDLHVCATTIQGGVLHAIRYQNGRWTGFGDVLAATGGSPGFIMDVDCAGFGSDLQIAMTSIDGKLFHAIRLGNGAWTGLGDVENAAGQIGTARKVTVTNFVGELNLTTVTNIPLSVQFNTIRHSNGSWGPFVTPPNNITVYDQAAAGAQDFLHLLSIDLTGVIMHRTRDTVANWGPVGNVYTAAGGSPGSAVGIGATTSLGF